MSGEIVVVGENIGLLFSVGLGSMEFFSDGRQVHKQWGFMPMKYLVRKGSFYDEDIVGFNDCILQVIREKTGSFLSGVLPKRGGADQLNG
jgi:hypothetical protein